MMSRFNFYSLKAKILSFYVFSFFVVFGSVFIINFFMFDDYLEKAEIKKVHTIAEMIAGNISAPLQLGLDTDVRSEMIKQIERNSDIVEIEVKEPTSSVPVKTGYSGSKKISLDECFVIERDIYDALGIQKLATVRVYYAKTDFSEARLFVAKTLFLLFVLAFVLGVSGLFRINQFFAPLANLTQKLNDFNPERPNIKLQTTDKKDEMSIIQNSVALTLDKLISYQQKIIHINENLEDTIRDRTKELNEQIELFRVLADASPNALMLFDTNLIYANPAFSRLTGYDAVEFFRKKIDGIFEIDEDSEFAKALDISNPQNRHYPQSFDEIRLRKKDGSGCFVSASIAYLHIKDRDAAIINLTDLTALKQKDQMLLVQSRFVAMGEMIGNIAHQWRQPLNIIQSSITKISIYKELGEVSDEFLDETVKNVKRQVSYLSSTIDDFRSFYKDDPSGSFVLEDAVNKSLSLVESVYKNHFIDVEVECNGCKNVKISGSINRFIQALLNILNNSKDAIVANEVKTRIVRLSCTRTIGGALLSIVDSGGGISAKNLPKVFDPYFSTKNKSQGTGIGLYMTRQIIENSFNATIEAKNAEFEKDGKKLKGASFTIELHDEEMG